MLMLPSELIARSSRIECHCHCVHYAVPVKAASSSNLNFFDQYGRVILAETDALLH